MEYIRLNGIEKNSNIIKYDFEHTDGLAKYFSQKPFIIEYPFSVESIPDSIMAIPFVCNVLPIIWITNSVLEINELDEAFYNSIPQFKQGYIEMFPESAFLGEIKAEKIVKCNIRCESKSAAFFSGGLDAVNTLVMHLDEKPALISIWGSDIRYENTEGWNIVHNEISKTAHKYELADIVIRSTFREFDSESELDNCFSVQLKNGWWHGVKHGIGLIGHAAPYAYFMRLSKVYIASSNCPLDENIRCASHPTIDNFVRYANTQVIHDGFEFSRQDKARNVVSYSESTGEKIPVRVCWETQAGKNCCKCEKCYRTMAGLLAEGADPVDYSFFNAEDTFPQMQKYLIGEGNLAPDVAIRHWTHIKKSFVKNIRLIKKTKYWEDVKWMLNADFAHPETLQMPPKSLREWLSRQKFYQKLHELKNRILNKQSKDM